MELTEFAWPKESSQKKGTQIILWNNFIDKVLRSKQAE